MTGRWEILLVVVLVGVVLAQQQPVRILSMNEVKTMELTPSSDTSTWKIEPLKNETNYTYQMSVSVFPLLTPTYANISQDPTIAVYASYYSSNVEYGSADVLVSTQSPDQSLIIPPTQLNNTYLYIYVKYLAPLDGYFQYTVSANLFQDALDPTNVIENSPGVYLVSGRVNAGQRFFYNFSPSTPTQLLMEVCYSMDNSSSNAVYGAFLYDTTTDIMQDFNQEYVDFPCGNEIPGNIVVTDPTRDNDSRYLKICPSIVTFSTAVDKFFAVDVLRFWQAPIVFGYIDFSIFIYTTNQVDFPLEPAGGSNPSFVEVAPLNIDDSSSPDLVVTFSPWSLSSGEPIADVEYGFFSDVNLDDYSRQLLVANGSFASGCFLLNQPNLLFTSEWVTNPTQSGQLLQLTVKGFFSADDSSSSTPIHINVVANSPTYGTFAYEYVSLTDADDDGGGLSGWEITLIVLAVLIAVAFIIGVLALGAFAFIRYRKRGEYEIFETA